MARKLVAVVGMATALVAGAATAAQASGSFQLTSTGVSVKYGYYEFKPAGTNNGAFYYSGNLIDTSSDGNAVFIHGKVEGYDYGPRLYNATDDLAAHYKNQYLYDPAETATLSGLVQACRDRGTLFADNCADTGWKYR